MSDIFISYAREDRSLAQALANDLQARGYRVWWDSELVGSDDFQEVILAALAQARAAVVIWTKASVKSNFVRDEARYALHYKKLVATRSRELEILEIPFGFQGQHTVGFDDREEIVRAITKLGAVPAAVPAVASDTWDSVQGSRDINTLLAWLERNPTHDKRQEAVQRVRSLVETGDVSVSKIQGEPIRRTSNLSAFLSGLTFRIPSFQLSSQGTWSSIGLSIGLVGVLIAGAIAAVWFFSQFRLDQVLWGDDRYDDDWGASRQITLNASLTAFGALLCAWIIKNRISRCVNQRNFVAAWVLAPFFILTCFLLVVATSTAASSFLKIEAESQTAGALAYIAFAASILLPITYMILKVRSAR
jgi:hypothetical protein